MTRVPVTCRLCGDQTPAWPAMLEHLRLLHPDVDREVEWPDSSRVLTAGCSPQGLGAWGVRGQ